MHQISREKLKSLQDSHQTPCISLYQPTHRQYPDNEQDPIRYRNLLMDLKLEMTLRAMYSAQEVQGLLENFQKFSHDNQFWNHRTDGLAIFGSPERFEIFELQRPIQELLIVADSFHTKPLMRVLQSADRYQILCINRYEATLYEGNRDALDPVELTNVPSTIVDVLGDVRRQSTQMIGSYGTRTGGGGTAVHHGHCVQTDPAEADMFRFFKAVDRGILEHHSRPSELPLMLAALPQHYGMFRKLSHNPYLMGDGIAMNPDALSLDELRRQAWRRVEPMYLTRLEKLKDDFQAAYSQHAGSSDLSDVAKAATAGRVGTLLVEADRVIHGVLDKTSGSIRHGDQGSPLAEDMLDDLAELVTTKGGEVVVVPKERMPTESGLAAIYRY